MIFRKSVKEKIRLKYTEKDVIFFIPYILKMFFIPKNEVRVNNAGEFSNGITTIESMYAPEFRSHTKGVRIKVE